MHRGMSLYMYTMYVSCMPTHTHTHTHHTHTPHTLTHIPPRCNFVTHFSSSVSFDLAALLWLIFLVQLYLHRLMWCIISPCLVCANSANSCKFTSDVVHELALYLVVCIRVETVSPLKLALGYFEYFSQALL